MNKEDIEKYLQLLGQELLFPEWTWKQEYVLTEPWFLYNGRNLRAWQLVTTPAPFKMRNIYGGDRMLERA